MPLADDEITVTALASGSSGNAILVTSGADALLLDAGVGVRTLRAELTRREIAPKNVRGICVTHEHCDHMRGAVPFAVKYSAPIVSNAATLSAIFAQEKRMSRSLAVATGSEVGVGPFGVQAIRVSHDAVDPIGFRVTVGQTVIAYATDTGYLTQEFRDACVGASLICVEANHDLHKLRFGPYPEYLKERILSRKGHLSNNEACDFALAHCNEHGPTSFWFLHLSETNNTPRMVMNHWKNKLKMENIGTAPGTVEVALRDRPSLVWRTRSRAVQLPLF